MAIEIKKTRVKMNKPLHLGMSILDIIKTLMYKEQNYVIQILIVLLLIL